MNYALLANSQHLVKDKLNAIIKKLQSKQTAEVINYDLSNSETSMIDVLNDASTIPFLSEHKVIVINNPLFLTSKNTLSDQEYDALASYLKVDNPTTTLIFYNEAYDVDNRKKAMKLVKKHCEVYAPKELKAYDMADLIKRDLRKYDLAIEADALNLLIERVSNNFDGWQQECEKLILYNAQVLTIRDIDLLIGSNQIDNVFKISDAIMNKDLDVALIHWRNQPVAQREPISMMMLLASQFRLLHHIKTLLDYGFYENQIAKELKVHPYRVQKSIQLAHMMSSQKILEILNQLSQLDQDIKNGKVIPKVAFELFLVKVCR